MLLVPEGRATAETWITSPSLPAVVARVVSHYQISHQDAEDLLQEVRIALWEAGQALVGSAWVARIASHKAVDLLRGRVRARAHIRAYATLSQSRKPDPEVGLLLHARVTQLPARLRNFYELRYLLGWTERELVVRLGVCRASVRWLDYTFRRAVQSSPTRTLEV